MLDVHVPPHAFFQPAEAAEALTRARQALGPVEVERTAAEARGLEFDEVLKQLRTELEAVL
jgi:hypothetical protein